MGQNEINQAIKQICEEKNISFESVIETIAAALAVAYRKDFGEKNQNIKVEFNPENSSSRVFDVKTVVADEIAEKTLKLKEKKEKGEEVKPEEEDFEKFDPKKHLTLTESLKLKKGVKLADEIKTELFPPAAYGRMAAQTAKQVIIQRLREAERENLFKDFKGREGEIITGIIQRQERRFYLVDLGQTTGIMPPNEQIMSERYLPGSRIKVYVVSVNQTTKGPEIIVSRAHPDMVKRLFTLEVPEISAGTVEIKAVSREAGSRTKIAVKSNQKNIDPVGSCVGQRGSRVQTIISEIGGEKIDIIQYSDDPVEFITNALSPAKILSIKLNEKEKTATAEVKEDQLSLAIGKAGQNVRLAAKLTGWRIDIISGEKNEEKEKAKNEEKEESEKIKDGEKPAEAKKEDKTSETGKNEKIITEDKSKEEEKEVKREKTVSKKERKKDNKNKAEEKKEEPEGKEKPEETK
ncbi:MAG: transcription termination factor NusA [Patescibacteria group bacterium]